MAIGILPNVVPFDNLLSRYLLARLPVSDFGRSSVTVTRMFGCVRF